jgi:hypothetical protein
VLLQASRQVRSEAAQLDPVRVTQVACARRVPAGNGLLSALGLGYLAGRHAAGATSVRQADRS